MRRAKWPLAASICLIVMSVAPSAAGRTMIIAHRGIYQTFDHAAIRQRPTRSRQHSGGRAWRLTIAMPFTAARNPSWTET